MSSASIKKIIPCKKEQLVEMVLDIEKYPEFVPWCIEGRVLDKNESADFPLFRKSAAPRADCGFYLLRFLPTSAQNSVVRPYLMALSALAWPPWTRLYRAGDLPLP